MKVGLLHGLCSRMDEILPNRHSQPRVLCAWGALGFLLQTNIATMHVRRA